MTTARPLYRADDLPVFQNRMYHTAAEAVACPLGTVDIVEDLRTGLVHNRAFDPSSIDYDEHYQNEQGISAVFRQHLAEVFDIVATHLRHGDVIEVGCGKGYFLEMLAARGFKVRGFDPSYESSNPLVTKAHFSADMNLSADGLVLRHVLEHVGDPVAFLRSLRDANGGRGLIYIEVPCFEWISTHRAWFDVFYEHVNYFRLADFRRMFDEILAAGHLFGGQYLYVVASLASLRDPAYDPADPVPFPPDFFQTRVQPVPAGVRTYVWGGASKGVIFASLRERLGRPLDGVVDINPAKQGKYLPATGLCVMSPAQFLRRAPRGSIVYVMNPNYLEEIKAMSGDLYIYEIAA